MDLSPLAAGTAALAPAVAVVAAARSLWSPCGLSMLTSINPVAERSRGHRYPVTAGWFLAGAVLGGLGTGTLAAGLAAVVRWTGLPAAWSVVLAVLVLAVGAAADLGLPGLRLPTLPRQVDEQWLRRYRPWVYAGGFGVQIGTGLATYVMTAAVYGTVLLAALTGQPWWALAVGALFGLVRGLAVLLGAAATDPARLRRLVAAVERRSGSSLRAAAAAQVVALAGLAAWCLAPGQRGAGAAVALAAVVAVTGLAGMVRRPRPAAAHLPTGAVAVAAAPAAPVPAGADLRP
ncbi:hypothetical protein [Nakamurella endophytica]|uniref:Cytochrome c biogenesis protein CcdA n=1 Tax=Nakamurella endophytica TaxID=1748367 RepID=A0A917TD74_9ACTN|nr:hypothetical protein [Nakamurella endophytica]GGM18380.1 hypothetical protein GCM10011594_43100 [Nakamurella endophytica]